MPYIDLRKKRLYLSSISKLTPSYVNQCLTTPSFMLLPTLSSAFRIMVAL